MWSRDNESPLNFWGDQYPKGNADRGVISLIASKKKGLLEANRYFCATNLKYTLSVTCVD